MSTESKTLPSCLLRVSRLCRVIGPAIFLPADKYGEIFLVTGGDNAFACFLSGGFRNSAFPVNGAENWSGIVAEEIFIEVYQDSIYFASREGDRLGSMVFQDRKIIFVSKVKSGHFDDVKLLPVSANAVEAVESDERIGFVDWRAVIFNQGERFVIFDTRASAQDVTP